MFTVVLSIELGVGLLKILLNSSSVLPFNSSDSVGSGMVVEPLPRIVLDSKVGLTVEIVVATPTSTGIEVLPAVVPIICSIVLVSRLVLVDGTTEISSTVDVITGALVVVVLVEVLGRTVVLVLKVVLMLLEVLIVVVVVLEVLLSESELASKF